MSSKLAINKVTESNLDMKDSDYRRVSKVIYNHCGINLHEGKKSLVRARLAKRMRSCSHTDVSEYLDFALADKNKAEFYSLVDSISTNLTSFFRERVHFDYMIKTFLPNLIAKKEKNGDKKVRIWSAGCSSGEEPYTIAIVLKEFFANLNGWDFKILASDVSTQILEMAQQGVYDSNRVKPLTQQQKQRFLTQNRIEGKIVYQASNELKQNIRFRYLNLMEPWPFSGPFDVIFCRNVMIYFDKPTQEKLVNRYWQCLGKGGLFCIGHSESLSSINHKYQYIQPATYMK